MYSVYLVLDNSGNPMSSDSSSFNTELDKNKYANEGDLSNSCIIYYNF